MPGKGQPTSLRKKAAVAAMAASLVGGFEGLRLVTYMDPVGIPTACFGETKNIRMGMKFTKAECEGMLTESLLVHDDGMIKCTKVPLPDTRHVALLSFTYNVGVGNYCGSTLVKKLNAGDVVGACQQLLRWDKVRIAGVMVPLPGLTTRRTVEYEWCMKGLT